jgi:ParB family chromosome partitioning protein
MGGLMADTPVVKQIRVDRIVPSRHQTRQDFNEEGLKGLAESIKSIGLKTPVAVRRISATEALADRPAPDPLPEGASPNDEWWELLDGERRLRAHKLAGLEVIQVIEYDIKNEADAKAWVLVANLQRENLNPIEEAVGYDNLNKLDPVYWTHEAIAAKFGKDRSYVTKSIGILELPQAIKEYVLRSTLTRNHAIQLMRLSSDDLKVKVAEAITVKSLSVQGTSQLIDKMLNSASPASKPEHAGAKSVKASKGSRHNGVSIAKSARGIHIEYDGPADTPTDTIAKTITEEHQKWQAEQGKPKLDLKTEKVAIAAKKKADEAKIDNIKKALKSAQAYAKDLKKAGKDNSGKLKEIEELKAELQALKPNRKSAGGKSASITSPTTPTSPLHASGGQAGSGVSGDGNGQEAEKWEGQVTEQQVAGDGSQVSERKESTPGQEPIGSGQQAEAREWKDVSGDPLDVFRKMPLSEIIKYKALYEGNRAAMEAGLMAQGVDPQQVMMIIDERINNGK